jgi:hypothetical protein
MVQPQADEPILPVSEADGEGDRPRSAWWRVADPSVTNFVGAILLVASQQ